MVAVFRHVKKSHTRGCFYPPNRFPDDPLRLELGVGVCRGRDKKFTVSRRRLLQSFGKEIRVGRPPIHCRRLMRWIRARPVGRPPPIRRRRSLKSGGNIAECSRGWLMLVDPSSDGGAATPNLPALIAAVVTSIESDEKNSRVRGGF